MAIAGPAEHSEAASAGQLLVQLQSRVQPISAALTTLLQSGGIEDPADQDIVIAAMGFMENPMGFFEHIKPNTTNVGAVVGGYAQMGQDCPPEIDALHGWFWGLQCVDRMICAERLAQGPEGSSPATVVEIQEALTQAHRAASILSNGYKDPTFLAAVDQLRSRLGL